MFGIVPRIRGLGVRIPSERAGKTTGSEGEPDMDDVGRAVPHPCGLMTEEVAYWVAYPWALRVVPITDPEFGATYFGEHSKVPSVFGYTCTHLVLCEFQQQPTGRREVLGGVGRRVRVRRRSSS